MHEPDATSIHLRRASEGDAEGIAWVVQRFTPLVLADARYRLLKTPLGAGEAEDLTQDVWVVVLPVLGELGTRNERRTPVLLRFIASTLHHLIGNRLKRRDVASAAGYARDEGGADRPLDAFATVSSGVVTRVARGERRDQVLAAIEELSPQDREIVLLRGVEQRDNGEVAALLALEPNTAAVRYRRALARLRERIPGGVFDEIEAG